MRPRPRSQRSRPTGPTGPTGPIGPTGPTCPTCLRRAPGTIVTLALGSMATGVHANEPPRLAPVEINAPAAEELGTWDAASEGEAGRREIAARALLRPAEALEAVPGMVVTQHSGTGKANQYFLRGFNLDHGTDFATWVAGTPVNMPTHAHGQGYSDLNFLIPELIARITFRKGPYAAEDGDFASAGSARIDYVDALARPRVSVGAGAFGWWRGFAAGSTVADSGRWLYALELQRDDGPWRTPERLGRVNAVLRWSRGDAANGASVTAMSYAARWNATDQIPRRALDAGTIGRFDAIDPSDGGRSRRASVALDWRASADGVTRRASAYAIASSLDLWSNFTVALERPASGDQFQQSERRVVAGAQASQTWFRHWGARHVFTTLGLQLRRDRLAPVALYDSIERRRTATVRSDAVTVDAISPYLSNTVEWSGAFRTIAGLRLDHQRYAVASRVAANSGSASATIASPKLSLVFGPWSRTEYFVNWGLGLHSNDARGATIRVDPRSGETVARVDPLVRTRGVELGLRTRPLDAITASLALWRLSQASELVFSGDAGTTEPSRPSMRTGVEALARWAPAAAVTLDANLALTRARFRDDDAAGPFVPGAAVRVAGAGLTVGGSGAWSGSIRWLHFGPRPLVEDGSVRSASTSLVNARVAWAAAPRVNLVLDVLNVLDRKADDVAYYYTSRLAGEPARGVGDVHFHPVEPRSLRLTLVWEP